MTARTSRKEADQVPKQRKAEAPAAKKGGGMTAKEKTDLKEM